MFKVNLKHLFLYFFYISASTNNSQNLGNLLFVELVWMFVLMVGSQKVGGIIRIDLGIWKSSLGNIYFK